MKYGPSQIKKGESATGTGEKASEISMRGHYVVDAANISTEDEGTYIERAKITVIVKPSGYGIILANGYVCPVKFGELQADKGVLPIEIDADEWSIYGEALHLTSHKHTVYALFRKVTT